jgi:threonine synthase
VRWLRCLHCDARFDVGPLFQACPRCAERGALGVLDVGYDYERLAGDVTLASLTGGPRSMWSARALLPLEDDTRVVSLGEGGTPLVAIPRLAREVGCDRLHLKLETVNPTWSHKDRYNSVVVSMARSFGLRKILTYTTGNHGNSLAAYAAAAGLEAAVFLHPRTSGMQRSLGRLYGAQVVVGEQDVVKGTMAQMVDGGGWIPSASFAYGDGQRTRHFVNPFGTEGYKTLAYELASALPPQSGDHVLAPVGYGDLLTGIWKGYGELLRLGLVTAVPRMVGCQTTAGDPLAQAVKRKARAITAVEEREGLALSIIEGRCSDRVLDAVAASGGLAESVDDDEIDQATAMLGRAGICAEPASAVPIAVLRRLLATGALHPSARVICVITSAGVKWPEALARLVGPAAEVHRADDPVLRRLAADGARAR